MAKGSKYKFSVSKVGDTITIDGIDVYSMKNSLVGYNTRKGTNLEYEQVGDQDKFGRFTFKRTS